MGAMPSPASAGRPQHRHTGAALRCRSPCDELQRLIYLPRSAVYGTGRWCRPNQIALRTRPACRGCPVIWCPVAGFEPPTCPLQGGCTAAVLTGRWDDVYGRGSGRSPHRLRRSLPGCLPRKRQQLGRSAGAGPAVSHSQCDVSTGSLRPPSKSRATPGYPARQLPGPRTGITPLAGPTLIGVPPR